MVASFEVCPIAAHGLWKTGAKAQLGLTHTLSLTQSAAGLNGSATAAWLVAMDSAHLGEDFRLPYGATLIGAHWDMDLPLTSPGMSGRHARISCHRDKVEIDDIGGKDGVLLNGKAVKTALLEDGDDVRFGGLRFVFRLARRFAPGYRPTLRPRPATQPIQTAVTRRYIMGWLVAASGDLIGQDFRLIRGDNRVGSAPDLELTLPDMSLPRVSCVLVCTSEGATIRISSDGFSVKVNGQDARADKVLRDSDLLDLGGHEFYVKWF